MKRKFQYLLLFFALVLVVINLHFWNMINIFHMYNDITNDNISDVENKTFNSSFEDNDNQSEEPIYADEGFTEEEIRLFGPLEEREVSSYIKYSFSILKIIHDLAYRRVRYLDNWTF